MIPTEPIGSIPRPPELVAAIRGGASACGLAPVVDDDSVSRPSAFARVRAWVEGTRPGASLLEGAA